MDNPDLLEQYSPIRGIDKESFAGFTFSYRLPLIIDRMIRDNDFNDETVSRLKKVKRQIANGKIEMHMQTGADINVWNTWILPYVGCSWFEVPFYFAEAYFYRLILDLTNYFNTGNDPFFIQKTSDVYANHDQFSTILKALATFKIQNYGRNELFRYLLHTGLWGNKADLSQLHLGTNMNNPDHGHVTLIDDSNMVGEALKKDANRVDIILDNSGLELFTDLIMAEEFIANQFSEYVVLHTKAYPMFVSDAIPGDLHFLVKQLTGLEVEMVNTFGRKIFDLIRSGKLIIHDHGFWNSPLHFYEMPDDLYRELQKSDLIIVKGDANYRRVFGDRNLPMHMPPQLFTDCFPAPAVAIRILKSEILLGLDKTTVSHLMPREKDWLINGKYGILQKLN